MKNYLILFALLLTIPSFGQDSTVIRGKIFITSYSQGGAELLPEEMQAQPYSTTLYVVQYIDSSTVPLIVKHFQSNPDGSFYLVLPKGVYGIVSAEDIANLDKGQFSPRSFYESDEMYNSTNIYWTFSKELPIHTEDASNIYLEIQYYNISSCGMCP